MTEKKERKPWQEMTFRELDNDALIEHAQSLGRKKAVERRLKSIEDQNEGRRSVQLCRPSCYFFLGSLVPLIHGGTGHSSAHRPRPETGRARPECPLHWP